MTKRLYFAYGSNMNEAQMALRCPDSKIVGIAMLENHRFLINERGVASIAESQGKVVYGLLWSISQPDERQLDCYEGVGKGFYRKLTLSIAVQEHQTVDALLYVASCNEHGTPRLGYMETILRAAMCHNFSVASIEELKSWLQTDARSTSGSGSQRQKMNGTDSTNSFTVG